ncbi:hypothetical protein KM043_000997 [Ampulex compressa]|nr:hypothetical protein KM043_000997 [Ampulex compressa]
MPGHANAEARSAQSSEPYSPSHPILSTVRAIHEALDAAPVRPLRFGPAEIGGPTDRSRVSGKRASTEPPVRGKRGHTREHLLQGFASIRAHEGRYERTRGILSGGPPSRYSAASRPVSSVAIASAQGGAIGGSRREGGRKAEGRPVRWTCPLSQRRRRSGLSRRRSSVRHPTSRHLGAFRTPVWFTLPHSQSPASLLALPVPRRRLTEPAVGTMDRRGDQEEEEHREDDDGDVVCAIDASATIAGISARLKGRSTRCESSNSSGTQTIEGMPLRLRVLPSLKDIIEEEEEQARGITPKRAPRPWRYLRFLIRVTFSLFGLAWLLTVWAMLGAAAFFATEGPREQAQVVELKNMQRDLAVGLATELRQLRAVEGRDLEPLWTDKVRRYVAKHEQLLLTAVEAGYGEAGDGGQLWTFCGCLLFAISLLTTLGFGAPVPRTTAGRTVAVVFAALGIPAHFLLIMNIGILLAMRLRRYVAGRGRCEGAEGAGRSERQVHSAPAAARTPRWLKAVPLLCTGGYYLAGILCFGACRARPFAASLLFPLDFTAAGGLSTTAGYVRVLYGLYLEGAVTIAAVALAVLRVSATQSLTNLGLKYGLLIEA